MATLTSYSSFFSSGLLATHTPRRIQRRGTISSDASESWNESDSCPPSPMQSSSPAPFSPSSIDVEMGNCALPNSRRSATPTPHNNQSTPMQSPQPPAAQRTPAVPRLRRRRSSLSQAALPMDAIRSTTRAAGNALTLQLHLAAPARARSGSLGGDAGLAGDAATPHTGRMRSGSCSNALPTPPASAGATLGLRPRRAVRRIPTTPLPGLRAPPPTAPLPALPPTPSYAATQHTQPQQLRPAKVNFGPAPAAPPLNGATKPSGTSARARGLSVSGSTLSGEENRIDEMKEN